MTMSNLPAEWHPADAVLIAWPHKHTDWEYMLDTVTDCYAEIATAIAQHVSALIIVTPYPDDPASKLKGRIPADKLHILEIPTNDTWARDFGPITTISSDGLPMINDFKFNGWGLKFAADKDNLITRHLFDSGIFNGSYSNHLSFVLEGGSIESDGNGTLLTTAECLLSPNRNGGISRPQIEEYLLNAFGARKILWLHHGFLEGDDTDSHIDTLARLCPDNTILYSACDRPDDIHFTELSLMEAEIHALTDADGNKFRAIPMPIPQPIYDEDGMRLPATYANFLILNDAVLLPVYADGHYDTIAISAASRAFPAHRIIPINCLPLIQQHGSLHCITMQIPQNAIQHP